VLTEHGEERKRECRGFSGAGLGGAHHIFSLQNEGHCLLLNRCGVEVALGFDTAHDRFGEAELFESH
jgi:hypothetical protein